MVFVFNNLFYWCLLGFGIGNGSSFRVPGLEHNAIFRSPTRVVSNDDHNALLTSKYSSDLLRIKKSVFESVTRSFVTTWIVST